MIDTKKPIIKWLNQHVTEYEKTFGKNPEPEAEQRPSPPAAARPV